MRTNVTMKNNYREIQYSSSVKYLNQRKTLEHSGKISKLELNCKSCLNPVQIGVGPLGNQYIIYTL